MKRTVLTRRTALVARAPLGSGPDRCTVDVVLDREGHSCARCGRGLHGIRGVDWSVQHRRARGSGGTIRPDTNAVQNLLLLCGSGTTGCHGYVERERAHARAYGWAVRQCEDPLARPVLHARHGWVYLTAAGSVLAAPPPRSRAGCACGGRGELAVGFDRAAGLGVFVRCPDCNPVDGAFAVDPTLSED